jgi:hypothetical protein
MRFFRSNAAVYDGICSQLDAAYGYPNEETKTLRTLPLAANLPHDAEGRVYLAVSDEYCEYVLPSQLLPQLLASGAVEEVAEAQYKALMPQMPTPNA